MTAAQVPHPQPGPHVLRRAAWRDLDPATAYAVLRLRVDVFVVEQTCAYPELDGRDLEDDAEHHWLEDGAGQVVACLRVLAEPDGARRVGRVATRGDVRGKGLAAVLLTEVLRRHGASDIVLDAQSHLAGWYGRHGFAVAGPEFVEDGIPHVPMRRPGQGPPGQGREATSSASGTRGPV